MNRYSPPQSWYYSPVTGVCVSMLAGAMALTVIVRLLLLLLLLMVMVVLLVTMLVTAIARMVVVCAVVSPYAFPLLGCK